MRSGRNGASKPQNPYLPGQASNSRKSEPRKFTGNCTEWTNDTTAVGPLRARRSPDHSPTVVITPLPKVQESSDSPSKAPSTDRKSTHLNPSHANISYA